MLRTRTLAATAVVLSTSLSVLPSLAADRDPTSREVSAALHRAMVFFREKVATNGAYVYRYSADLTKREGEGKVGDTTAWTQPPGTPFVGEAFVEVYELTGDRYALEAARAAANALASTQLNSGGWDARIEFSVPERKRFAYRVDGKPRKSARNNTSLDDDKTQSCIRFLIRYDRATKFKDKVIHNVAISALESLLSAQFPNGGWPHVYRSPATRLPVKRASYSKDGKYQRVKNYWDFYTLNDGLMSDVVAALFLAEDVYRVAGIKTKQGDLANRCRIAAERAGDFLALAQMPDPQPGWAQQYDFEMRPTWARRFEPPAITGGESQGVMMTLLDIYEQTGKQRYLEPIPKALEYYRKSQLPDGRLARFYELRTNKPLFFTLDYKLTHSDADVPTHYSFKVASHLDQIENRYKELKSRPWRAPRAPSLAKRPSVETVRRVIRTMDSRGAWVEDGRLRYWGKGDSTRQIIETRTFARNVRTLARFLARDKR